MEKTNEKSKNKTIQLARKVVQFLFLILLILGLYYDFRFVFILLLVASPILGNFFCGWVCPYGTAQEIMGAIGLKIFKKKYKMPRKIQNYMQYLRYILVIVLITGVLNIFLKPINGYRTFMRAFPFDITTITVSITFGIMIFYLLVSMVFERPFCNYLCTHGARYGFLSLVRIFSIKRNESTCINCKKCDLVCPMNIEVSTHPHVRNAQCINCLKCIDACPVPGTLSYSRVKLPVWKNKEK